MEVWGSSNQPNHGGNNKKYQTVVSSVRVADEANDLPGNPLVVGSGDFCDIRT